MFDSHAGILPPDQYRHFSLKYIREICNAINEVPVTVFAKGAYFALKEIGNLNCETVGLDWNMSVAEAKQQIGSNKTLQGNLDPCVLYSSFKNIKEKTEAMLQAFGPERHIANLGHGVYPDTSADCVKCFIDTVKNFRH